MEAVILVGIQASGKSTFFKERFFETHVRINLDMLRTRHRERAILKACVPRSSASWPTTRMSGSQNARSTLRPPGRPRFRVIGYFFEPDPGRALAWNRHRERGAAIPEKGLLGTLKQLERPTLDEGYDELYRVRVDDAGAFIVSHIGSPPAQPPQP